MAYIDKTTSPNPERAINKQKFLERAERAIQAGIAKKVAQSGSIKNLKSQRHHKITISTKHLSRPSISYTAKKGIWYKGGTGNDIFDSKQKFLRRSMEHSGEGTPEDGSLDQELTVELTPEEFEKYYFHNMILPFLIKKSYAYLEDEVVRRRGYSKRGIPPQINLLHTMKNLIARQILFQDETLWLEEIDLKYNAFTREKQPSVTATMFCLLDVSGSMDNEKINQARQFFFLLSLFLELKYKSVEIRFIRFHTNARECDEQEFFYAKDSGETNLSNALSLLSTILHKEYDISRDNIYVVMASDGDLGPKERTLCCAMIKELLDWFNFLCYIEIHDREECTEFMELFSKQFLTLPNTGAAIIFDDDFGLNTPLKSLQDMFDKARFEN